MTMSQQAQLKAAPGAIPSKGTAGSAASDPRLAAFDRVQSRKQRSLWNNAWRQYRRHKLAMVGLFVFVFFILATFVGSMFYPLAIDDIDFSIKSSTFTWDHPFGTDMLGQDILARILWGGRISLAVGMLAALVAITLGTVVGAMAGFFRGADSPLMRVTDLFISLPQVPLLLLITFLFKDSMMNLFDEKFGNPNLGVFVLIVMVISILSWMPTARLVRASFLSIRRRSSSRPRAQSARPATP
jgi:peptide/nickel transport system permease protein